VTDPNAIAFRSVFKGIANVDSKPWLLTDLSIRIGLLIALVELVPVERIPDFPSLVEVWIALFGRSESKSVSGICRQFWQSDWKQGIARRAIFDVARSRFPIHFRPLIRLLRSMTAAGFLDTDPLSTADHSHEGEALDEECDLCGHHVFNYFDKLPTLSQVIPAGACKGTNVLYERRWERHGTPTATSYLTYFNVRPIKLPGGTTLPVKTTGRLLSDDGGEFIVLCWKHEHSGWKLILEVLTDYVNRRRMHAGTSGAHQDVSFGRRSGTQPVTLRIEDVGVEMDDGADQDIVKDSLDLVRSVIQGNAVLAEKLLESLEAGDPVVAHTMTEAQPPDLVQLTTMILEEALSRSATHTRSFPGTELITSAMSVLSALLAVPRYSSRVWLYIRSTTSLFGSDRAVGFASVALAAERATGHYTMTLALLHLVQRLFQEASSSVLTILPDNPRLQQIKEEVLLRAYRFVHSEIWVEYLGWKYAQLGDRFEIGRRVASLYTEVLKHAPLTVSERGFVTLSQAVADLLLHKATTSTINPLVSSITAGGSILRMLYTTRRHGDARRLIYLLESHLRLIRLVLYYKQRLPLSPNPCLLEQALCARVTGSAASFDGTRSKVDPIDVLATYAKGRDLGNIVPLEAMHVLYALCVSLSSSQPSPPTIIGHLSDPEATVTSLVRIIQHPYDELSLRNAVWNFISLAVDREPALASLFVTGQFRLPSHVSDERKLEGGSAAPKDIKPKTISAIDVANDTIANWKKLWELNPQLLASVLRFLDVVWQHGLEHKAVLENSRKVSSFWDQIASIASEELGPVPDYRTESYVLIDGIRRSHLHEAVSTHAYRVMVKSYALHIIGQDIGIHLQSRDGGQSMQKPLSYLKMERHFKLEDQLTDLISEAVPSSYDPRLYDELMERIKVEFPALNLEQLRSQEPAVEQEFGDDFAFSISLLQCRLQSQRHDNDGMSDPTFEVEKQLHSLNMNLSLAHSQTALAESWQFLLRQVVPYVRGDSITRPIVLGIAASISFDIASEKRSGDMMATIHGTRLSLLVALLEVVWFSTSDTATEIRCFIDLVNNVHGIILSEPQAPSKSFLGAISVPFHRTLLQTIYFCSRHSRSLARRPKALTAENRLTIASMLDATLGLVIDALGVVFNSARSRADVELDRDMELLVAVFQQCTRPDINPTSTLWLARCQEADVIKASLDLLLHADLTGLSDLPFLLSRRQPLYSPHILMFHMALGSIPSAAERLASEGVLAAYCNNSLSPAISTGQIDIVLPELPGERSPAHRTYCSMLAIVAGVVAALGRPNHYFNAEASGFVQLYGDQIFRALSWTIEDPITFPLLEEIEQVINLFYCIAESTPTAVTSPAVETVLGVFTTHALMLLQQLNYALTHPNHLASLLEPVTADERVQFEKESLREKAADPLVASLVRRLLKLSSTIVSTLISISRADVVLTAQQEDWPVKKSLVIPVRFLQPSAVSASINVS
jgi:nuclear pore complex protein Nup188